MQEWSPYWCLDAASETEKYELLVIGRGSFVVPAIFATISKCWKGRRGGVEYSRGVAKYWNDELDLPNILIYCSVNNQTRLEAAVFGRAAATSPPRLHFSRSFSPQLPRGIVNSGLFLFSPLRLVFLHCPLILINLSPSLAISLFSLINSPSSKSFPYILLDQICSFLLS